MYSSIAYAVVNEDDGLGSGCVSINESDVNWAGSGGVSVAGIGEDAETCRQCLDVHLLKAGQVGSTSDFVGQDLSAYFAQLPDSDPLMERIQGCPTPSFPPVQVISNGRRIPR